MMLHYSATTHTGAVTSITRSFEAIRHTCCVTSCDYSKQNHHKCYLHKIGPQLKKVPSWNGVSQTKKTSAQIVRSKGTSTPEERESLELNVFHGRPQNMSRHILRGTSSAQHMRKKL